MDPSYKTLFESLSPDDRYYLEERAAIHEFDGKLPREEAEKMAAEEFYESSSILIPKSLGGAKVAKRTAEPGLGGGLPLRPQPVFQESIGVGIFENCGTWNIP